MIELTDTTSSAIAAEFLRARRRAGSPAMGMVMTLVVVADEEDAAVSLEAAQSASREHPARLLGVVLGDGRGAARVDAEVGIGAGSAGERALIRLSGAVTKHPESVVLPLLLPDSPVVVWWPTRAPEDPAADPLGRLARRRITDAAAAPTAKAKALITQCRSYAPGNTDLAWTRVTPWRALLAAAVDQHPEKVSSACVSAERISPSADLLSAWLADRLHVDVSRRNSDGPGITEVVLKTRTGDVRIERYDGRLATLSTPGQPDRPMALRRRAVDELLAEELHRLDPDEIYASAVKALVAREHAAGGSGSRSTAGKAAKQDAKPSEKHPGGRRRETKEAGT